MTRNLIGQMMATFISHQTVAEEKTTFKFGDLNMVPFLRHQVQGLQSLYQFQLQFPKHFITQCLRAKQ